MKQTFGRVVKKRTSASGISRLFACHFASTAAHPNSLGELDGMRLFAGSGDDFFTGEMGDNQPQSGIRRFSMLFGPISYERDVVGKCFLACLPKFNI